MSTGTHKGLQSEPRGLHSIIDVIGDDCFANELLLFLNDLCGAEHCAIFRLESSQPVEMAAASLDNSDTAHNCASAYIKSRLWQRDPTMIAARFTFNHVHPSLIRMDVQKLEDRELREVIYLKMGQRLLLCGRSAVGHIALSVLKSAESTVFCEDAIANLEALASPLLSILGKHSSAVWQRRLLLESLSSLKEIEDCVASAPVGFPRREAQVCSRILYGVSSLGIALELGVSEETVMTYRKRVYHRLSIGTQRELLMWYVSLWSAGTTMPRRMPASLHG